MADEKITLPVSFGTVSFGKTTAKIGASCLRENLTLSRADKGLVGCRLTCKLTAVPKGQNQDQGTIEGFDEKVELKGIFDIKRIGVTPDEISFGLTANLHGTDRETFSNFAGRDGKIQVLSTEEIPGDEDDESTDGEADAE